MAKRMGAKTIEVKASHLSLISQPETIAKLILEAAGQTVWEQSIVGCSSARNSTSGLGCKPRSAKGHCTLPALPGTVPLDWYRASRRLPQAVGCSRDQPAGGRAPFQRHSRTSGMSSPCLRT